MSPVRGRSARWGRAAVAALLPAMLAGCGDAGPGAAHAVRDSAGVTVVESTAPVWGREGGWRVGTDPVLDLTATGSGPDHEFFGVTDATRHPDGSIVVAEDGSDRVRYYTAEGAHLRSAGRAGDAPGEFRRLVRVDRWRGDSVVAFDARASRATVLDGDGQLGRIVTPHRSPGQHVGDLVPLDRGGAGFVGAASDVGGAREADGSWRVPLSVVRFSPTGEVLDTVVTVPGPEVVAGGLVDASPLFPRRGHMAVGADRIVVGSSDSLAYLVFESTGVLRAVARVPGFDLRLTPDEVEAERAAYFPGGREVPERLRAMVDALPAPATRPAYMNLLVDPTGAVWAEAHRGRAEEDAEGHWRVFGPDGEWLGTVRTPPGFEVFEIGEDWVLGRATDHLDVERVQLLPLRR